MSNKCLACGRCCRLFPINISKKEFESGVYQAKFYGGRLYILDQKADGSCIYQQGNQCSIHSTRPTVCHQFFCTSKNKQFTEMIKKLLK